MVTYQYKLPKYHYPKQVEEAECKGKMFPTVYTTAWISDVKKNRNTHKQYSRMYLWLQKNHPELLL